MNQFFSHRSGANQRREIVNQITGLKVAEYETGNEASRAAAIETANNSNAVTLAALVSGGKIVKDRSYSLDDLQRAWESLN